MTHEEEQARIFAECLELVRQYADRNGPEALADLRAMWAAEIEAERLAGRLAMRAALGEVGSDG